MLKSDDNKTQQNTDKFLVDIFMNNQNLITLVIQIYVDIISN
jgi:hypothetical protein